MRILLRTCVLTCLMVVEVWTLYAVVSGIGGVLGDALVLLCVHLSATVAIAMLVAPGRGKARRSAALFIAVAGSFVPVIGLVGAAVALNFVTMPKAERTVSTCRVFEIGSNHEREASTRNASVSASRLRAVLSSQGDPATRIAALLAAGSLGLRNAIALYKIALRDPADEVRLLAFAKLDGHRRDIERRIAALRAMLDSPLDDQKAAAVHHRLAEAHDELAYLGLVEGDALRDALTRAAEHAGIASQVLGARRGSVYFTLGRVLLRAGAHGRAQRAFDRACACGVSSGKTAPYSAEIAFQSRDFARVRTYVGFSSAARRAQTRFRNIVPFWR